MSKKKTPRPAARKQRPAKRKPTKADKWASTALYDLLHEICITLSLLSTTARSLNEQQLCVDERVALELVLKMLRQLHNKLNIIADKVDDNEPVSSEELFRAGAFDDEDETEDEAP
jgi:hypothetical protein